MEPIFPGMDPYLEAPGIWPGFHEAFLSYAREALQPLLPERYYAELRTREEIGIGGIIEGVYYPDVAVRKTEPRIGGEAADAPPPPGKRSIVPEHLIVALEEPLTVSFLEVRDLEEASQLVTLIELLSPSNKQPGPDREAFEKEQKDILDSSANWVEIDLLRAGRRVACSPQVDAHCRRKGYDYLSVVSRSVRRAPKLDLEIYGFGVEDPLPVVSIPLRHPDPDIPLDLELVFRRAYETGPYRKIIRYELPADPPLVGPHADWARSIVERRLRR